MAAAKKTESAKAFNILSIHILEFHLTVKRLSGTIKRGNLICKVAKPSAMFSVHNSPVTCQINNPTIDAKRNLFVGAFNCLVNSEINQLRAISPIPKLVPNGLHDIEVTQRNNPATRIFSDKLSEPLIVSIIHVP